MLLRRTKLSDLSAPNEMLPHAGIGISQYKLWSVLFCYLNRRPEGSRLLLDLGSRILNRSILFIKHVFLFFTTSTIYIARLNCDESFKWCFKSLITILLKTIKKIFFLISFRCNETKVKIHIYMLNSVCHNRKNIKPSQVRPIYRILKCARTTENGNRIEYTYLP